MAKYEDAIRAQSNAGIAHPLGGVSLAGDCDHGVPVDQLLLDQLKESVGPGLATRPAPRAAVTSGWVEDRPNSFGRLAEQQIAGQLPLGDDPLDGRASRLAQRLLLVPVLALVEGRISNTDESDAERRLPVVRLHQQTDVPHRLHRDRPVEGPTAVVAALRAAGELGVDVVPRDQVVHPTALPEVELCPGHNFNLRPQVGLLRGCKGVDVEAAGSLAVQHLVDRLTQYGSEAICHVPVLLKPVQHGFNAFVRFVAFVCKAERQEIGNVLRMSVHTKNLPERGQGLEREALAVSDPCPRIRSD
nr:hypothetical protein [Streptacidiphilus albus]